MNPFKLSTLDCYFNAKGSHVDVCERQRTGISRQWWFGLDTKNKVFLTHFFENRTVDGIVVERLKYCGPSRLQFYSDPLAKKMKHLSRAKVPEHVRTMAEDRLKDAKRKFLLNELNKLER